MGDELNLSKDPNPRPQAPPAEDRRAQRRQGGASEPDLLSDIEKYPEYFSMIENGQVTNVREPCYFVEADCFLGLGREATLYEEGAKIVTSAPPNACMEPLNRAAFLAKQKWEAKLPPLQAPIDVSDMAEAAQTLASDPEALKLNKVDWQKAVVRLASELRLRREGKDAREVPPIGHNFVRTAGGEAPPLLNYKLSEMSDQRLGEARYVPPAGPQTRRVNPQPMSSK